MTKKIANIKAKVGEYTNRDGATKGNWIDVGYVLEVNNGGKMRCYYPWINLAGLPRKDGHDSVVLSEFDVKNENQQQPETHKGYTETGNLANSPDDEQIPF